MTCSRYSVGLLLVVTFMLGFALTQPAYADNLYASIRGTVVDPTGAVVPDAKLTATNVATGLSYSTTWRDSGQNRSKIADTKRQIA